MEALRPLNAWTHVLRRMTVLELRVTRSSRRVGGPKQPEPDIADSAILSFPICSPMLLYQRPFQGRRRSVAIRWSISIGRAMTASSVQSTGFGDLGCRSRQGRSCMSSKLSGRVQARFLQPEKAQELAIRMSRQAGPDDLAVHMLSAANKFVVPL